MKYIKPKPEDIKILSDFFKQYGEMIKIRSAKDMHHSKFASELSEFIVNNRINRIKFFRKWFNKIDGIWRCILWYSEHQITSEKVKSDLVYSEILPVYEGWYWLKRIYKNGSISYKPVGIRFQDGEIYINFWGAEWKIIKAFIREQKDLVKIEWAGPFYNPE